jgi:hypothetical protein
LISLPAGWSPTGWAPTKSNDTSLEPTLWATSAFIDANTRDGLRSVALLSKDLAAVA